MNRLVERYGQLQSLRLLTIEFQIDRSTARAHLKARSVALEPLASMTDGQVVAAIELYADGRSSAAIGRELGFTHKTVI